MRSGPLNGIKVLDLSRVLAGPLAAMVLGDLGADIIKVERPVQGDDTRDFGVRIGESETTYYYAFNRNKRSITIDITTEHGRELVRKLAADADVVVENMKPGGMEKFGLGFETLRKANPGLIYCAISGYDKDGPEASRSGYDIVAQGECGLMAINGEAERPPVKFGVAAVDMFTGMYAAQAILGALVEKQRTGRGQRVDLALHDCGMMISSYCAIEALFTGKDPVRYGNDHPSVVPYGVFHAKDGPVVIAVGTTKQFRLVCSEVLGRPDIAEDARYQSNILRAQNRETLLPLMNAEFAKLERSDLIARLKAAGVPCGEVLELRDALDNPRAAHLIHEHEHPHAGTVRYFGSPWRFDGERVEVTPPPRLGEHTAEIEAGGFKLKSG